MLGSVRVCAKSEGFIKYVIPWQLSMNGKVMSGFSEVLLAYQDFGLCI